MVKRFELSVRQRANERIDLSILILARIIEATIFVEVDHGCAWIQTGIIKAVSILGVNEVVLVNGIKLIQ